MSQMEIFLIVAAALVPVIALVMILPRHIKKTKSKPQATATPPAPKQEDAKPKEEVKPSANKTLPVSNNINKEDFKNYLNRKRANTPPPIRNNYPYMPTESFYSRRSPLLKKPQTLREEIQNLSPELKALIFSGALDKKYTDD